MGRRRGTAGIGEAQHSQSRLVQLPRYGQEMICLKSLDDRESSWPELSIGRADFITGLLESLLSAANGCFAELGRGLRTRFFRGRRPMPRGGALGHRSLHRWLLRWPGGLSTRHWRPRDPAVRRAIHAQISSEIDHVTISLVLKNGVPNQARWHVAHRGLPGRPAVAADEKEATARRRIYRRGVNPIHIFAIWKYRVNESAAESVVARDEVLSSVCCDHHAVVVGT